MEEDGHHHDGLHPLQRVEETMLIIAVPAAWCMLLFFAKYVVNLYLAMGLFNSEVTDGFPSDVLFYSFGITNPKKS